MKDYVIKWFVVFNLFLLMDESKDGKINCESFRKHRNEINLPIK